MLPPLSSNAGMAARQHRNVPVRLTDSTRSQSSSGDSWVIAGAEDAGDVGEHVEPSVAVDDLVHERGRELAIGHVTDRRRHLVRSASASFEASSAVAVEPGSRRRRRR